MVNKESSGTAMEMEGAPSVVDFRVSASSLVAKNGVASERLEDPDVDTVESDEDETLVGWPSLCVDAGTAAGGGCWFGAEGRDSCRS